MNFGCVWFVVLNRTKIPWYAYKGCTVYRIFSSFIYNGKCQTLTSGTDYWAFPVHTTFSDLELVSKSHFRMDSKEMIRCFLIQKKRLPPPPHTHTHCFSEFLQTVLGYNFALGLPIYTRFDYVGLVSRSQVCQNYKLPFKKKKIVAQCSLKLYGTTHIKKIMHIKLCLTLVCTKGR